VPAALPVLTAVAPAPQALPVVFKEATAVPAPAPVPVPVPVPVFPLSNEVTPEEVPESAGNWAVANSLLLLPGLLLLAMVSPVVPEAVKCAVTPVAVAEAVI
jgi:hypothetical protein